LLFEFRSLERLLEKFWIRWCVSSEGEIEERSHGIEFDCGYPGA